MKSFLQRRAPTVVESEAVGSCCVGHMNDPSKAFRPCPKPEVFVGNRTTVGRGVKLGDTIDLACLVKTMLARSYPTWRGNDLQVVAIYYIHTSYYVVRRILYSSSNMGARAQYVAVGVFTFYETRGRSVHEWAIGCRQQESTGGTGVNQEVPRRTRMATRRRKMDGRVR